VVGDPSSSFERSWNLMMRRFDRSAQEGDVTMSIGLLNWFEARVVHIGSGMPFNTNSTLRRVMTLYFRSKQMHPLSSKLKAARNVMPRELSKQLTAYREVAPSTDAERSTSKID
jgi:hypothetical protein